MKNKILIFIDWFSPGYKAGGPIQSISNFVNHFADEFEITIVTSNKDLGDAEPYKNIECNQWIKKEKYRIIYLNKKHQNRKFYRSLVKEQHYDTFYFNSLFSARFTLLPMLVAFKEKKRVVLAPRGMLGAGALAISKRKKQLFLSLFKLSGFPKKIIWQVTAETERGEVKQHFGEKSRVFMVPNLSAKMSLKMPRKIKVKKELNLFFLSRISPKKNLKAALAYLASVKEEFKVSFSIIGPIGDETYWEECLQLIEKLPKNITVHQAGAIPNIELPKTLQDQQVLLLPTFHENFGHVIMESFQSGCPVILSNHTPWIALENKKIGWDISLDKPQKFVKAIEKMANMDQDEFNEWSLNAFHFAKTNSNNAVIIDAYRKLFKG